MLKGRFFQAPYLTWQGKLDASETFTKLYDWARMLEIYFSRQQRSYSNRVQRKGAEQNPNKTSQTQLSVAETGSLWCVQDGIDIWHKIVLTFNPSQKLNLKVVLELRLEIKENS